MHYDRPRTRNCDGVRGCDLPLRPQGQKISSWTWLKTGWSAGRDTLWDSAFVQTSLVSASLELHWTWTETGSNWLSHHPEGLLWGKRSLSWCEGLFWSLWLGRTSCARQEWRNCSPDERTAWYLDESLRHRCRYTRSDWPWRCQWSDPSAVTSSIQN